MQEDLKFFWKRIVNTFIIESLGVEFMYQLFAIAISFSIIPILIKKKIRLSFVLLMTSGVLALVSNIGFAKIYDSVLQVFVDPVSLATILTVSIVGLLGGLMGHYDILGKTVSALENIVKNKKSILILIPAFVGLLIIPGGALLSAPFIKDLGEDLEVPRERRVVINLVFRHIAQFIMPYSTGFLIIVSVFPQINIFKIIGYNVVFISLLLLGGYFLFIRDIEVEITSKRKEPFKNIMKLLLFTSPIYIPVVINAITGWAFYVTLLFSVIIVYFLSDKKEFVKSFLESINWQIILTIIAILLIKEIILRMDDLLIIFNSMLHYSESIVYILFIFLITSIFFGMITGSQEVAIAVILPMLAQVDVGSYALYKYIYFIYAASFMGYYFSPLHLCQVFTIEIMGAKIGDVYIEYAKYILLMFVALVGTFLIF